MLLTAKKYPRTVEAMINKCDTRAMRIGYGYNRTERGFAHAGCDRVWIDGAHTERQERSAMLAAGLRSGDTLVLLAAGDLGRGGEITIIRQALADRRVDVDVCPPPPDQPPRPRGRPAKFDPSPEHDTELRRLWADPVLYTPAYVMRRASALGYQANKNALYHRYGKRRG